MVRVDFEIDPSAFAAQVSNLKAVPDFLREEIAKGLKVYLTLQGVTGLSFLDLNYDQEPQLLEPAARKEVENIARGGRLVYIPNSPSQIFEIGESISRLVRTMNDIDFVEISRDIRHAVKTIEQAIKALDAGGLSQKMAGALDEFQALSASLRLVSDNLDQLLNPGESGSLGQAMEASAGQLRQSIKRLDQILGAYRGGLPETVDNLRAITENLREMSELLKNQPSQALFGRPPRATEPGRKENVTTFTLP